MIHIFRKNQRVMMLVVAILTIIAFIWLYNPDTKSRNVGPDSVGKIYGRNLTQADIDREIRNYGLALTMGQLDLISSLGGTAENENVALSEFIWNLQVLQHQAKELGVHPTDMQVADRIKTLPVFSTDGQFDPRKYAAFIESQLGPKGFTQQQLDEVIRDALRLERLRNIIGAPVAVSEAELAEAGRIFQKVDVQRIPFPLSAAEAAVSVTDEEVQGLFTRNQSSLIAPETRAVEYIEFAPPAGQPSAEGKARIDALQKLADAATAFADQAASSSFARAAATSGLTVQTTPDFDRAGAVPTGPADQAEVLKNLAPAAFLLNEANPISDPLQSGDKFYVIKLAKVSPQRPLTIEEVRPLAERRIKSMKAANLLRQNADAALAKIREAVTGGKSLADAAAAAGLTVESFQDVALTGETPGPNQDVAQATFLMQPGQVSGFLAGPDGGFAVYLAARAPWDAADFARQKSEIESGILENKKRMLFMSWLASAREAAKISVAQQGR